MKKTVIAYPHIHFDREWYREFEEFRLRLTEIFDVLLEEFEKGELEKFFFDGQTSSIDDYLEIHPEKLPKIKKLIKEKKLFVGPFYCLSDMFLTNHKFIRKNLEIGMEMAKAWGCNDEFIGYLADTFGHSNSIYRILGNYGIDKAILWRGVGNLNSEVLWNGLKTVNLIQGYFHDEFNQNLDYPEKSELIKKTLDKIAIKSSNVLLLPIGADHLCPPRNLKTQVREINKYLKDYEIKIGTPFDYFELVENNFKQKYSGEFLDNSKTFLLKGSYSCRSYIKQKNAQSQWFLGYLAEPLNEICNGNFQKEIDYAYKLIIQNHAHDSIYGCSTDDVDFEVQLRYKKADQISKGIIERLLRSNSFEGVSVVNLGDESFSGAVEIETSKKLPEFLKAQKIGSRKGFTNLKLYNINEIPVTEDYTAINKYVIEVKNLKPKQFTQISQKNIETNSSLKITEKSIENEYIKLSVNSGKIDIFDKINNKKYKDFLKFKDRTDLGDSYNFAPKKGEKPTVAKFLSSKIKMQGKIRSVLRLNYKINSEKITLDVILDNLSKYLAFDLTYNNKRKNHILQAILNTDDKITKTLSEDTYGEIERNIDSDYDIDKFIPAPRGVELKINTFPMQRYVCANGIGLLSKGLQEYECFKNELKLTLLRSVDVISNPKNSSRGTPAGPPLKFKGLECLGKNTYKFALTFDTKRLKNNADNFFGTVLGYNK